MPVRPSASFQFIHAIIQKRAQAFGRAKVQFELPGVYQIGDVDGGVIVVRWIVAVPNQRHKRGVGVCHRVTFRRGWTQRAGVEDRHAGRLAQFAFPAPRTEVVFGKDDAFAFDDWEFD